MSRFEVLEEDIIGDSIMKAVGFRMKHLETIPFPHLPGTIQVKVIEEVDVRERIKLVNVTSEFRGYLARNGTFGRHIDEIKISLLDLQISVQKGDYRDHFDFLKDRTLFSNICSCDRFELSQDLPINKQRLDEFMK